jgi:predicted permease
VILLALGLKLSFKFKQPKLIAAAVLVRMVFGFAVSLVFVKIFSIDGIAAEVILLIGAAPIGFNSITFAEMENLDAKYAAAQVSLALILAMIFMPVLISAMPWLI